MRFNERGKLSAIKNAGNHERHIAVLFCACSKYVSGSDHTLNVSQSHIQPDCFEGIAYMLAAAEHKIEGVRVGSNMIHYRHRE